MMLPPREQLLKMLLYAKETTYLTHNFHPFPGKFIPQIPNFFIDQLTHANDVVFDPFCGSGTTLAEAKLLNRNSIGIDIHPLGVFMSKVKTTKVSEEDLNKVPNLLRIIKNRINDFYNKYHKDKTLLAFLGKKTKMDNFPYVVPEFPNRDHWFQQNVLHELTIIKTSIVQESISDTLKNFLLLAFSSIIVSVSNQESDTRYAAVEKHIPPKQAFLLFKNKLMDMIERIKKFNKQASSCKVDVYNANCRIIDFLPDNSVDLIVTSPPYPNTYDYYLYHKLRMFWLDLDWEKAKFNEIGSRLKHSSQKEGVDLYLRDMTKCFQHFTRILKSENHFVIIVGDSIIKKKLLKADRIVHELAEKTGFKVEDSVAYNLSYVSKTFNPAFRSKLKKEHIILLKNEK